MTRDPLDDLKSALHSATPRPDPARRAATLRAAATEFSQENSLTRQGSADAPRPTPDRPAKWGLIAGVKQMLATLPARGALTATTALAAVGLIVLVPALQDGPPSPIRPSTEQIVEAVKDAPDVVPPVHLDLALEAPAMAPVTSRSAKSRIAATQTFAGGANAPAYDATRDPALQKQPENTEAFPEADPNPVKVTTDDPVSTFSVDVDTASYGVIRSSLMAGVLPPRDAVRIEEMVNYFPYLYPAPTDGAAFSTHVSTLQTPWNDGTQLVHIGIQGALPAVEDRPPLNLVFLIDTSGSMQDADKLPLLKQSFRLMLSQLRPEDEVAIVAYAGSAGTILKPTAASERSTILTAIDALQAGGSTAGQQGLELAYAKAEEMSAEGEVSRVILATDGDFNVGLSSPRAMEQFISDKRDSGTYLSVLGFGRGNLDDATMQALAQNGNGTAAYIDTLQEAQKVLVDQLTGALFPIADDVKIQVEFNPAQIAEYRLIGYETRILNREDFNNDKVDAGDIGAGHSVTAIYEVVPVGSGARLTDDLRYAAPASASDVQTDEWGYLKLRHKAPGASTSTLIETPITAESDARLGGETAFAAAIAGFGQVLRGSVHTGDWGFGDAIALASGAIGDDPFGYRAEAVRLMRLAQSLAN